jgi:hypothetical protein
MTGPRTPRLARMGNGAVVTTCPGCHASPVRDDGRSERLHEYNWLRTCARCGRRLCRVCLPEDARVCMHCAGPDRSGEGRAR